METIYKPAVFRILKQFYNNRNMSFHLRALSRRVHLNESSLSRHLDVLVKSHVLKTMLDGNRKQFCVNVEFIPRLFPLFDYLRLDRLPLLRRNAINMYLRRLDKKPIFALVFGSTAKGTFRDDSDIDVLEVFNMKTDTSKEREYVEAQTRQHIQSVTLTQKKFIEMVKSKDPVILAAIKQGFPIFNRAYFYEVFFNE